MILQILVVKLK